ncbi:Urease accessory protein UreE [Corynebacterium phocae]|uniref:Urease accessory protein UreE n=1 Tax=Corynebacterium phocae TaxID=161895 RepID=A0A1L7D1Y3_9CORY|nr:urease accessory protein UreE [Corynebacterium phocae]APT91971.1 Urease accessory protein UreE [Corynebacterium phocae]KAA8726965.1 urease accessory protein UreE [Corynebacterium phocae]
MLITEITGNVADGVPDGKPVEYLRFNDETRLKRVQRVTSQAGQEYALRLGNEVREIRDGDIFAGPADRLLVAAVEPTDVLVIEPASIEQALEVAHTLGNRHLQAQFFGRVNQFGAQVMVVRYDHTVEHYLDHVGVKYYRGDYVMPKAFRHAEHTH